jgi:hypothetical protein
MIDNWRKMGYLVLIVIICLVIYPERKYASSIVTVKDPYSYNQMVDEIEKLQKQYPFLKTEIIGQSHEGRNIYKITLGNGQRSVQLNGSHHGREWITTPLLMQMLEKYSYGYQNDSLYSGYHVKDLLDKVSITFIPMVNPDGVQIAQYGPTTSQRNYFYLLWNNDMPWDRWKANAIGVDPNSNYNAEWASKVSVSKPYYFLFKGTKPEEAKEVQAMVKDTKASNYVMTFAYHSSGEIIYWYHNQSGSNLTRDRNLVNAISSITSYEPMPARKEAGGYTDWVVKDLKIPAFTMEVAKRAYAGAQVPLSQYSLIWQQNHKIGIWAVDQALKLKLVTLPTCTNLCWDGTELKPGQIGRVEVTKHINLWRRDENNKLIFDRILRPGEKLAVFNYDNLYGGQYNVGENLWVTKIDGNIQYRTPSKAFLEELRKAYPTIPSTPSSPATGTTECKTICWNGVEMKKGQIGRITITKPINLWVRDENNQLIFSKVLKVGEQFPVLNYDNLYGGQYNIGDNQWITKISGYIKYETPSKSLLNQLNEYYKETPIENPEPEACNSVCWEGHELKEGQIGILDITKRINLWERDANNNLIYKKILNPGETYPVFKEDGLYGGQYQIDGNLYVTKINGYISYKQIPADKLQELNDYYGNSNNETSTETNTELESQNNQTEQQGSQVVIEEWEEG